MNSIVSLLLVTCMLQVATGWSYLRSIDKGPQPEEYSINSSEAGSNRRLGWLSNMLAKAAKENSKKAPRKSPKPSRKPTSKTPSPVHSPTKSPVHTSSHSTSSPSANPTTWSPTKNPTTKSPTNGLENTPTKSPTKSPTSSPSTLQSHSVFVWNETAKLTASDGAFGDSFGNSVSIDGNIAILGASRFFDNDDDECGSAYVYEKDESTGLWIETAKLTASDGAEHDQFGSSVSVSGNVAIVGQRVDENDGSIGSAHVYEKDVSTGLWDETAKFTLSNQAVDGVYSVGTAVSVSGNIAIVCSVIDDDVNHDGSGSAYVYEKDELTGLWTETAKLTASDGKSDFFGYSVSVAGDIVIVGAIHDDDNGGMSGSAYIFEKDESSGFWTETAKLTASDGAFGDSFGWSVFVSGNTAIVGAPYDDDNVNNSGSAYVYERGETTGLWTETTKLTASDGAEHDQFGNSVSISDKIAVVGAWFDDSAYVFEKDDLTGLWTETAKLTASDGAEYDRFGHGVSVSNNIAIIGAFGDDDNGDNSGSVYIFEGASKYL